MAEQFIPDADPQDRQDFLTNSELSNDQDRAMIYQLVSESEQLGLEKGLKGISADQIIDFAEQIRMLPTPTERYLKTLELSPTGKLWFDELYGFSTPGIKKAVGQLVGQIVNIRRHKFGNGVDLGTGTGVMAKQVAGFCNNFTALDRSSEFLQVAKSRLKPNINLVAADVTKLPFTDDSFDLMTSAGLIFSLDQAKTTDFLGELGRCLRPSGIYLDGYYQNNNPASEPANASWKDALSDMIVDTTSGRSELQQGFDYNSAEFQVILDQFGLSYDVYSLGKVKGVAGDVFIRIISKQGPDKVTPG
jgi:SAM-dependent methyltransferase